MYGGMVSLQETLRSIPSSRHCKNGAELALHASAAAAATVAAVQVLYAGRSTKTVLCLYVGLVCLLLTYMSSSGSSGRAPVYRWHSTALGTPSGSPGNRHSLYSNAVGLEVVMWI